QYRVLLRFFFSSRRRHTRFSRDWSSDVCSSDLSETTRYVVSASPSSPASTCHRGTLPVVSRVIIDVGAVSGKRLRKRARPPSGRSEERRVGKESGTGGREDRS